MSIQSMIDAALPGDTVNVAPGIYFEQLVIHKPLILRGPEPAAGQAIIDAAGMAAVPTLQITSSQVTIQQMIIQNGPGRGIQVGSATSTNLSGVLIENCTIQGHVFRIIITFTLEVYCTSRITALLRVSRGPEFFYVPMARQLSSITPSATIMATAFMPMGATPGCLLKTIVLKMNRTVE